MFGQRQMLNWLLLLLSADALCAMQIPQDVEILEGYEFDDSPEYYTTSNSNDNNNRDYYEARNLLRGLTNAVRNRRATHGYEPSKASASASAKQQQQQASSAELADATQMVDSSPIEVREAPELSDEPARPPPLPRAAKQIMDPDYDYYSQRRLASWSDAYPTPIGAGAAEADNLAEATRAAAYAGSAPRGRQARVNFITQPRKDSEPSKELPEPVHLTKVVSPAAAPLKVNYESRYGVLPPPPPPHVYNYDAYPSRSYDPYLRRYDRSYDEPYSRYDPYNYEDHFMHRRHYDPYDSYSPRVPQYPEPYYNYPDRRYDIPEPRDYSSNEIYDKSTPYAAKYAPPPADYGRNQRRIVYYAHLPEIVRTPYDYPGRYDHDRFDGLLTANKGYTGAYKYDKPGNVLTGGGAGGAAGDPYDYMKRDKKDRATPKPNKPIPGGGRQ